MAQDLKAEHNRLNRLFEKFSREAQLVTIASVALIISILSLLMAWMSADNALEARIMVEVELRSARTEIQELREDIAVSRIRNAKIEAWLTAHGINVEEITK